MKYTIEGFNQAKAVELGLCVADLIILRWFVDFSGTEKMVKRIIDGREYYWIKYEGLLEDLPILSITKDTLYRRLKGLVEKEVLEHITLKEAGTYSFYKLGKNYLALVTDTPVPLSEKNPRGYGKKSERGTEKNPYLNTNLQEISKEESKKAETESYEDIINALVENKEIREALFEFIKMRKLIKKPMTNRALKRIINKLLSFAGDDADLATAILDQSIVNSWQDIYPLKGDYQKSSKPKASMERFDPDKDKLATGTDGKPIVY